MGCPIGFNASDPAVVPAPRVPQGLAHDLPYAPFAPNADPQLRAHSQNRWFEPGTLFERVVQA